MKHFNNSYLQISQKQLFTLHYNTKKVLKTSQLFVVIIDNALPPIILFQNQRFIILFRSFHNNK